MASEEMSFENVDGRTDDGAFDSGELTRNKLLLIVHMKARHEIYHNTYHCGNAI